ncbi:MAG: protein-methionine-sulfoxide reductase catalytic subunit MsrP [Myxococcota bacterium]|nr:protein-methionine-sulfoxide reductase catalytic subunit MsrP [Myxococcota bacterium]
MLIRVPPGWTIPEHEVTPEHLYRNRRQFLKSAAAGTAALGLGGLSSTLIGCKKDPPGLANLPLIAANRNETYTVERPITDERIVAGHNNYHEFTVEKEDVAAMTENFRTRPWQIEISGEANRLGRIDVDDLIRQMPLEERIYRLRCVDAWSVVVPWIGFPLAKFVEWAQPRSTAKYLRMTTFWQPGSAPGQKEWASAYFEVLTIAEATNEMAMLVVGSYGHQLPNQNGAPIRLIVPWKYGLKSIKAIVRFQFASQPSNSFWSQALPSEYDFYCNVDPSKPHPRWSQETEIDVATGDRIPTRLYNGYEQYVAHMYT